MELGFDKSSYAVLLYHDIHLVLDARAGDYLVYLSLRAFGAEQLGNIRLKRKSGRTELEDRALKAVARRRSAPRLAQFGKSAPVNFLSGYSVVQTGLYVAAYGARKRLLRAGAHEGGDELFRIKRLLLAVSFCD